MNGKIAADTNAVIAYRANVKPVCRVINTADIILLPCIVMGELLYGAENSQRVRENKDAVYKFLKNSIFLTIDENTVARYASVRHNLKKIGRPVPENDIWIAAMCIESGASLLTRDSHFRHIQGLQMINWIEDSDF